MARSKYIISDNLRSSNSLSTEEWTISISTHQAPKGEKWGATNQLEYGVQQDIIAADLIQNPIAVTNMAMATTKSGKEYELGKFEVPLFCAVKWADKTGARSIKKVETVSAMVFDFDGLTDEDTAETLEAFEGLCHIAYTSYSNKAPYKNGLHAFRVIVALDRPVLPEEYADQYKRGLWFALESIFPHLDQATKDPCRFWFMPSFRVDRESDFFAYAEDGAVLLVDELIKLGDTVNAQPQQPRQATTNANQATANTSGDEDSSSDEDDSEEQPARYIRTVVRDTHLVTCHDLQVRPFSWIIEHWDTLPKQTNGNYNCCRPASTTVGSAFVFRTVHPRHLVARYRLTSAPNRTHHDCDRTDNGIALTYDNRGGSFRPTVDVPNVIKMIDLMNPNLFRDARTGYDYYNSELFTDYHFTVLQEALQDFYRLPIARQVVVTAAENFCERNEIDTLKIYLEDLKWDGVPRAEELFIKYLKADDTKIHRVYARKWLISCVARAMVWGCKVDTMVILKGAQGIRKSSFFAGLAGSCSLTGNSYFSDEPIETTGTDGLTKLRLAWIHEWAELSGMSKKESGEIKQFLTKQTDRYRRKFTRKEVIADRHCVIVGTVNDDEIFKDDTGSRRFWAIECGGEEHKEAYDMQDLLDNRDQLWAEAVALYKSGEQWWLSSEEQEVSATANSKFDSVDVHQVLVEQWLANNGGRIFKLDDMIDEIYNEEYEVETVNGSETRKRAKAIKPKTYMNWYSTQLKALGCSMLNDGRKCRHNNVLSRWYVAPTLDEEDEFVATHDLSSGKQVEIRFNTDDSSDRYGMVVAVRNFGQDWTNYEDMSPTVQKDWDERYPKKQKLNVVPEEQGSLDFKQNAARRFRI